MKFLFLFLLMFIFSITLYAQLQDTRWKATLQINGPINTILYFKKDTVSLYTVADSTVIEIMSYTNTDTSVSLIKTEGNSDCDNATPGKYGYVIEEDTLFLRLLEDDCYDRSSVLDNTKWTIWKDYPEAKVDEETLKQYTGTFELDDAHPITITLENGKLYAEGQNNGLPKSPLTAISETTFFLKIAGTEMEFIKDADGNVTGMISHESNDYELKKVK